MIGEGEAGGNLGGAPARGRVQARVMGSDNVDYRQEPPDLPPAPFDTLTQIGGPIDRVSVCLRFVVDDLDPESVSALLQCQPSICYRKGDQLSSRTYRLAAKTGAWILRVSCDEGEDLEAGINRLLDMVSPDLAAWAGLGNFRRHDVFCGLHLTDWNRGGSLSPQLMQRLSKRDLTLDLDIYFDGTEASK